MPVDSRSLGDGSGVGRFPTVSFGFGEGSEEDKEEPGENAAETENACWSWLRKACSCCCPKPSENAILIKETDDEDEDEVTNLEKPVTDDSELDGNWHLRELTVVLIVEENAGHVIDFTLMFVFCRTPPQSAINRPDEKQIRGEPYRAPHKSVPK